MPRAYHLNPDQIRLSDRVRDLARDVLRTHARDVDVKGRFPDESVSALGANGLLGLFVPKEFGGGGEGLRLFADVADALAQECSSTAMVFVMHGAATQAIAASTTFVRKHDLLSEIARGQHLTTLAFSERGSRSHFWAPVSQLATHNGGFVISAEKSWVTAAGHAHSYVASAQQPGASSPLESTLFLVRRRPSPAPLPRGARLSKQASTHLGEIRIMSAFDGLGLRGNESAPVVFDTVTISRDDLITPLGEGAPAMLQVVLPWFNVGTAGMANGLCRAAVAATSDHLEGSRFESTGTALRDIPVLRARLADMSVRTEQASALLARALDEIDQGSAAAPLFVLQTRLASIEAAVEVTDLAMKACGGAAFSRQLDLERLFRDARAGWVMAPTADHLREFIGRAMTGLPLF